MHDLKENVVTPYVMVEAVVWFFALPFFGRAMLPRWYQRVAAWLEQRLVAPVGTTLTVDKLSQQEAYEMVAMEQGLRPVWFSGNGWDRPEPGGT